MEVRLEKRFPLAVDADRAWLVLRDIRAVAASMPGAEIGERVDANHYQGTVKVKVGPANAVFGGEVQVLEIDPPARRLRIIAKGADRGGSSASMDLTASLGVVDENRCVLIGSSHVIVNGKFAQFGGRLIGQVSEVVLAQFADNFAAAAAALPGSSAAPAPSERDVAGATAPQKTELSAFAILSGLVKNWFLGLFGKRA
jgi:carbon monoxide dehydrogenase subunit G